MGEIAPDTERVDKLVVIYLKFHTDFIEINFGHCYNTGMGILRSFRKSFLVLCLILLAGCLPKQEFPLRVATNVWPGYETLYLARSLGFYDHLPIRLVELTSATEVSHALRNGTVEAAALTLDETLNLIQDGVDLKVVLVMDISNGADVLVAKPEIQSLQGLTGKRIGVESGATGAVMLDAALQVAQRNIGDIKIVPIPVNEHLLEWQKGGVDAVVTFEPYRSELISRGGHVLFDSSQIPGRIVDVLVVRADAADAHRDQLKKLVAGYFDALGYLEANPLDASQRMAPRLAIRPEQVLEQLREMKLPSCHEISKYLAGDHPGIVATGTELASLMLSHHLISNSVNLSHIAEPGYLPECH